MPLPSTGMEIAVPTGSVKSAWPASNTVMLPSLPELVIL